MAARNGRGCSRGKRSGRKAASKKTRSKQQRKARKMTRQNCVRKLGRLARSRLII